MKHGSPAGIVAVAVLAGAIASRDASGRGSPSDLFVGTWLFPAGAAIAAQCDGGIRPVELGGDTLAIRAVDASTVELELGCHCALVLAVDGSAASLRGVPQLCDLVIAGAAVHASVTQLDIVSNETGDLMFDFATPAAQVGYPQRSVNCAGASTHAVLTKVSAGAPECGPDDRAIGVLPYGTQGTIPCYIMAGTEDVEIFLQQESDSTCSYQSGDGGEGHWVLPQATRQPIQCAARSRAEPPAYDNLAFCRIDGAQFKPLTRDPTDTANFYAVLNLGVQPDGRPVPCPNGSTLMKRYFQNEEDPGAGNFTGGRLGPNVVQSTSTVGSTKNDATLYFCYFRSAAAGEEIMAEFPDLGFPYAVFHAFDGPQPPWVTLKRWVFSSDESRNNQDLPIASSDPTALAPFGAVIEAPTNGTIFNIARVR